MITHVNGLFLLFCPRVVLPAHYTSSMNENTFICLCRLWDYIAVRQSDHQNPLWSNAYIPSFYIFLEPIYYFEETMWWQWSQYTYVEKTVLRNKLETRAEEVKIQNEVKIQKRIQEKRFSHFKDSCNVFGVSTKYSMPLPLYNIFIIVLPYFSYPLCTTPHIKRYSKILQKFQ